MSNNEDIVHRVVNNLAEGNNNPKKRKLNHILKQKHRSRAKLVGNLRRLRTNKARTKKRCSQCYPKCER